MGGGPSHLEGGQPLPEGFPVLPGGYRWDSVVQVVTNSNLKGRRATFTACLPYIVGRRPYMDKYNSSHKPDSTAYQAITDMEADVRRHSFKLASLLSAMAAMAGFDMKSVCLRHRKTGFQVTANGKEHIHGRR